MSGGLEGRQSLTTWLQQIAGVLGRARNRDQSIVGLMNRKFQLCFVPDLTRPDHGRLEDILLGGILIN